MDLTARRAEVAESISSLAGRLSFLLQWVLYRAVAALSPLRERVPGLGRDDDLWAFGARGGEAFADNAKYLYLHVTAERPDVRAVWLSKDPAVVAELQSAGYEAYRARSPRGLLVTLRAGVVVLTQGHRDLAMPCSGGAFAVMLWHGVPLKRVSWDAEFPNLPASVRAAHADMAGEFDLLTIPGRALADPFESGLRIDRDRMAVVGYPRNDALLAANRGVECTGEGEKDERAGRIPGETVGTDAEALARVRNIAADNSLVCYLPTFREWADESVADRLDFDALDAFLAERDAVLVVKTHPNERLELSDGLSRVVQLPESTDPYPFLRHADALVTDYSSVYFDFLLSDRPVVFYPYDLDEYRARRGFYFDYDDVTPGPVARTFDDLLAGLDRALARPNADAKRRREVRNRLLDGDPVAESDGVGEVDTGDVNSGEVDSGDGDRRSANGEFDANRARPAVRSAAVYDVIRKRLADRDCDPDGKTARERRIT